jgi:hypothetical protein
MAANNVVAPATSFPRKLRLSSTRSNTPVIFLVIELLAPFLVNHLTIVTIDKVLFCRMRMTRSNGKACLP